MITPDEQVKAALKNEVEKLKAFGASPAMQKEWMKIHKEALKMKYNLGAFENELFGDE